MSAEPVTIDKDQTLTFAMERLKKKKVGRLLVIEKGKLVGVLTKRDIAKKLGTSRSERLTSGRAYVSSAMSRDPIRIIPDEDATAAARLMAEMKIGGIPVVEAGELVGIITETNLLNYLNENDTPVSKVMTKEVVSVSPETRLTRARELILKHGIWGLPVIDNNNLVGIITEGDIAEAFETFRRLVESRHMPDRVRSMFVKEIMSGSPLTVNQDDKVSEVAALLKKNRIDGAPVLGDNNDIIGVVTKTDLIKLL
jgi:CBS domain-containing protein